MALVTKLELKLLKHEWGDIGKGAQWYCALEQPPFALLGDTSLAARLMSALQLKWLAVWLVASWAQNGLAWHQQQARRDIERLR